MLIRTFLSATLYWFIIQRKYKKYYYYRGVKRINDYGFFVLKLEERLSEAILGGGGGLGWLNDLCLLCWAFLGGVWNASTCFSIRLEPFWSTGINEMTKEASPRAFQAFSLKKKVLAVLLLFTISCHFTLLFPSN